jgi:hypothetical protein
MAHPQPQAVSIVLHVHIYLVYVTMVTASNVSKTILQWSIHSQIMFTNQQNRATIAHNNLISVQFLYGEALVYHSNNTKYLKAQLEWVEII